MNKTTKTYMWSMLYGLSLLLLLQLTASAQQTLNLTSSSCSLVTPPNNFNLFCNWANSSGCNSKGTTNGTACAADTGNGPGVSITNADGSITTTFCNNPIKMDSACHNFLTPLFFTVTTKVTGGLPPDPCLNSATVNPSNGPTGQDNSPDCSPIIIDTEGEGFHFTSAAAGVSFDISGTGQPVQIAWTDAHYHNAFLALPGSDGLIHNGKELFGNFTPQPPSDHPNGFIALAQYDKPENGGNGDGIIDENDVVFSQLRLWIDENHDGICQPNELHRLTDLGVYSLGLGYAEIPRTDQFGNQFRYKARVNPGERRDPRDQTSSGEPGRWAYDVFLVVK